MRDGRNKLIAVSKSASMATASSRRDDTVKCERGKASLQYPLKFQHQNPNLGPNKRKWLPPRSHGPHKPHPAAKRIRLSVAAQSKSGNGNGSEDDRTLLAGEEQNERDGTMAGGVATGKDGVQTDSDDSDQNSEHNPPTEKLTNFAYRETSRVRQQKLVSRNMHWSNKRKPENEGKQDSSIGMGSTSSGSGSSAVNRTVARPKAMGLIRVQPNEKTTPICPTFLRGVECQNQYCQKRHDVPRDCAMPVCSFFQRHGQCLKGDDCVFRHVKVNARAVVCPSFSLLGFCEDNECTMQHTRVSRGVSKNSNGR